MNLRNSIEEIEDIILKYDSFLITSHVNPDGDNLGSVLALKLALEGLGKKAVAVLDDTIPDAFTFLPRVEQVKSYKESLELDFDAVFILDSGEFSRIGRVKELINEEIVINIDHHADNTLFGDYNLVGEVAATGELVYQLLDGIDKMEINSQIATALATALITDTGSFRYSSTTTKTHLIMAELLKHGVDSARIIREIYNNNSYKSLVLRGEVLRKLEVDSSGKVAWVEVSQNLLEKVGASLEDTEGLVGYPLSLKGVEVAILFKEIDDKEVRVSLRANTYFPVNEIAHQFNGGGHLKAAGCTLKASFEDAIKEVVTSIKKRLDDFKDERNS